MLAPGEFLTCPIQPDEIRAPIQLKLDSDHTLEPRLAITTEVEKEPEYRSFLLTFLRALGAVHT